MKTKPILFFFLFSLLLGNFFVVHAAKLPHQGRVLISGKAFEGKGSFRFALVDTAGNLVWNHQGTTGEPTTDLTLDIKGGFYSIALGDPSVAGMADLPASLFTNYAGLKLRIWFNDGTNGLQQLGTDQALLVAPYALSADSGSAQRIASLEASLSQALSRIATLEQPPNTGGSGSIQNFSTTRTYPRGALVILGQDSFIATTNVPAGASPPNSAYWTNLSVAANALNVPVETIPTLSTDTILNALPGTSPGGPTQPGPSLPGEVAATSRSYIFVDGSAQYQEVTLPSAAQNVGKEYVVHSKISDLLIKGNKGEIDSKDYGLFNTATGTIPFSLTFVSNGREWKITKPFGTVASGTSPFGSGVFADIQKGTGSGSPSDFAVLGNHLYFKADDGINGAELWKTDGTVTGTMMVKDLNPGANGSNPTGLTAFNNALYFAATDANGTELWKSDGTTSGTLLFKEFVAGAGSGSPTNIRVDGNQLRFNTAQESWNSDGTLAGTVVQAPSFSDNGYVRLGNWYYYSSSDNNGTELWRSDGSQNGAQLFKDIYPGSTLYGYPGPTTIVNSSSPGNFFLFNNTLYFSATDANGTELWKSDGTLAGTVMVKDLYPGSYYDNNSMVTRHYGSAPRNFQVIDNELHFSATDANETALWKTDGTANGTEKLHSLLNLNGELIKFENALYYQGQDLLGAELHKKELNAGSASDLWASANDLGNDWKSLSWFGTYYVNPQSGWITHGKLGSVYLEYPGNWLYHQSLGWMWTSQTVYPFLYRHSNSDWLYMGNQDSYYSYFSNSWVGLTGGFSGGPTPYDTSTAYAVGETVIFGQESYQAITSVAAGVSPPGGGWSAPLVYWSDSFGAPTEAIPTLSTSTILASLPGSTPNTGGPSAPTGATHVVDLNSTVNLEMIRVEPGTFTMGSPLSEANRGSDETEHNVTLTKPFYLGKYEVTQAQYEAVMTGNTNGLSPTPSPSSYVGNPNRPVEQVSWDDVQVFLARLNAAEQAAGRLHAGWSYVLPTEAQWEYACRAGTTTAYFWGDTITPNNANHNNPQTSNVGQYAANLWGFFDMHGNLWEWTADRYGTYPTGNPVVDPTGPASGSHRVLRGGSWDSGGTLLRSAKRYIDTPSTRPLHPQGFRVGFQQQ